jgi:hypothetical protein
MLLDLSKRFEMRSAIVALGGPVFNSALSGYACGTTANVAAFDSGPWLPSSICSRPDRLAPARQQLPDAALTRGAQMATRSRCPRRRGRYQTCHLQGNSGVSISQLSALRGIPSAPRNSIEICEATLRLRGATRSPIRLAAQKTPRGITRRDKIAHFQVG